jgi:hypothetical protein
MRSPIAARQQRLRLIYPEEKPWPLTLAWDLSASTRLGYFTTLVYKSTERPPLYLSSPPPSSGVFSSDLPVIISSSPTCHSFELTELSFVRTVRHHDLLQRDPPGSFSVSSVRGCGCSGCSTRWFVSLPLNRGT